jgi:hypothetical protein
MMDCRHAAGFRSYRTSIVRRVSCRLAGMVVLRLRISSIIVVIIFRIRILVGHGRDESRNWR